MVITDPVVVDVVPVAGGTRLQYVFPALISMITLFLSLMLSITLVMMEKTNTASVRNRVIPVKKKIVFVIKHHFYINLGNVSGNHYDAYQYGIFTNSFSQSSSNFCYLITCISRV